MTITTELLNSSNWINATTTQNFTLGRSNNGVIRVYSNSGTTTVLKDNGGGTFITYFTVDAGVSKEAVNVFGGNYRITGTNFNYEKAD